MAFRNERIMPRFDEGDGMYPLPPMRLGADDLREIAEFMRRQTGREVEITDADSELCNLSELDKLSDHKLSQLRIATKKDDPRSHDPAGMVVYLSRARTSQITPNREGASPGAEQVYRHIVRLSRARLPVRVWLWITFGIYVLVLLALPLWYALEEGADARLVAPIIGLIAAASYTGAIVTSRLSDRVFLLNSGTKIESGSREEDRRRRRDAKYKWKVGVPTAIAGTLLGAALTKLVGI